MEFLFNNWELVATVTLLVVGVFFAGKRMAYFKWANETLFFAWDQAEKLGIAQDLPAYAKIDHYLSIWRRKYVEKFGKEPGPKEMAQAHVVAAELSVKEKAYRSSNPTSPSA